MGHIPRIVKAEPHPSLHQAAFVGWITQLTVLGTEEVIECAHHEVLNNPGAVHGLAIAFWMPVHHTILRDDEWFVLLTPILHPLAKSPDLLIKDRHVYVRAVIIQHAGFRVAGQPWRDVSAITTTLFFENEVVDVPHVHRHGFAVQVLVGIPDDGEILQAQRRCLDHAANG